MMKGCQILFALTADKPNRSKNLGVVFTRGKTAIWILDIMSCNDNILSYFNKVFIVSTGGTGKQAEGWTIFHGHDVYTIVGGWRGAFATQRKFAELFLLMREVWAKSIKLTHYLALKIAAFLY